MCYVMVLPIFLKRNSQKGLPSRITFLGWTVTLGKVKID